MKINIHHLSHRRFFRTVLWAVIASAFIVTAAAGLGRAARNFEAALTDKPDVAVYLLLEDENITTSTVLREQPNERDYLVETKSGPMLVKLKRGAQHWYVSSQESLRAESGRDAAPEAGKEPSPE